MRLSIEKLHHHPCAPANIHVYRPYSETLQPSVLPAARAEPRLCFNGGLARDSEITRGLRLVTDDTIVRGNRL